MLRLRALRPIVAFLSALLMWGIAPQLEALQFAFPFQRLLAYALVGSGVLIDVVSIFAFRSATTAVTPLAPERASSLVVSGLYRFTRNPMYLALLFILIGVALLLGSLAD